MSGITTHVLDISQGRPARGVAVRLEFESSTSVWQTIGGGMTDDDGRLRGLLPPDHRLLHGDYRIIFQTGDYFGRHQVEGFYPEITIHFTIRDETQHYHVPLLLSPYGYSTYRGS